MKKTLFLIAVLSFMIFPQVALADELPDGITAEQGTASASVNGFITRGDKPMPAVVTITFWNVGKLGGDEYATASMTTVEEQSSYLSRSLYQYDRYRCI